MSKLDISNFCSSGDIYICDYEKRVGSLQSGVRPCIIIDNPMACAYSNIVHCCPLTTEIKEFPLHYLLKKKDYDFLKSDSDVLCEQYGLIDKSQLHNKIGKISPQDLFFIVEKCKQNLPF